MDAICGEMGGSSLEAMEDQNFIWAPLNEGINGDGSISFVVECDEAVESGVAFQGQVRSPTLFDNQFYVSWNGGERETWTLALHWSLDWVNMTM